MARYEFGWIKMHRKLISPEWTLALDVVGKGLLVELVMLANWKDSDKELFKHRGTSLKIGQLVTSENELTARLRVSRKVLRDRLKRLEQLGSIEVKRDNHGTIITICNYDKYQCIENTEEQPRDNQGYNQGYNQGTTKGTHSKEYKNNKNERIKELLTPAPPVGDAQLVDTPNPVQDFIKHYCDCYKSKFNSNPVIDGRTAGIAKRLVKDLGINKSKALIEKYLQMHDQWFITRHYDLTTFESNLNKIETFRETGRRINSQQAKQEDIRQTNEEALQRFAERLKNIKD